MGRLNPNKLHVIYLNGAAPEKMTVPRRYTLTHSDRTGELFLSIGGQYDTKKISKLYTRLMRDEVLAELVNNKDRLEFRVHCHVSGGFILGSAGWRYSIFRSELPLALEAIKYGDRLLFENNPETANIPVYIHFHSGKKQYNIVEQWGTLAGIVS
ncbi:MAG TPA: staygreen family protein [Dehalococcoidales bacterium]|nr:staygreen family protein [Dehalococcoidales bacterium]